MLSPSTISQPLSTASAPRLCGAAQEKTPRRLRQKLRRVLDQELRIDAGWRFALTGHRFLFAFTAR